MTLTRDIYRDIREYIGLNMHINQFYINFDTFYIILNTIGIILNTFGIILNTFGIIFDILDIIFSIPGRPAASEMREFRIL